MSLEITRGDDRPIYFWLWDENDPTIPRVLGSGEKVLATFKRNYGEEDDGPTAIAKSSDDADEILWEPTVGLAGRGTIYLQGADTKALPNSKRAVLRGEIQLIDANGKIRTILADDLVVNQEVTLRTS